MPNHVATNFRMTGNKAQIAAFIKAITLPKEEQKDGEYDFRRLLPCPKELEGVSSPVNIVSEEEYKKAVKEQKQALAKAKADGRELVFVPGLPLTAAKSEALRKKYGADNWYTWMQENYGTKWGMYDIHRSDKSKPEFSYNTAWSPATKFYLQVSKQFPKVSFYHEYADEGGFFVGYEIIQDGELIEEASYAWKSDKGIEIRMNVGYYHDEDEEDEEEEEAD